MENVSIGQLTRPFHRHRPGFIGKAIVDHARGEVAVFLSNGLLDKEVGNNRIFGQK